MIRSEYAANQLLCNQPAHASWTKPAPVRNPIPSSLISRLIGFFTS